MPPGLSITFASVPDVIEGVLYLVVEELSVNCVIFIPDNQINCQTFKCFMCLFKLTHKFDVCVVSNL